jgi:putative hydrolase of the HAD superfamily
VITTIVFDLDDTLYDEVDYCRSGLACVADFLAGRSETSRAEHFFEALWQQFTSGNRTRTFNAALDELGMTYDDKLIAELIEVYRNHEPKIALPTDSKKTLDRLSKRYTLALLTDGFLPAQQLKVRALGIEHYFKSIVYTEQLGRQFWKPSPAGFEKLLQNLQVEPKNAVYVADNEKKDFIAPRQLGLHTIRITRPTRMHTEPAHAPHAAAQHIIDKISQLPALLRHIQESGPDHGEN